MFNRLSKVKLLEPLPFLEKMREGIFWASDLVLFCLNFAQKKIFFFLPWRNLHIIFSNRVSQEHILSGKHYMCYHLALIYHLNTHAIAMCFTQQCELRRMALDGVSWVPFQLPSTFITLWPWLSHSTFFLWVSTKRREMNRDDMCKIHVLWGKGGCCVNLIVRHEQLAMHLYDIYLLWEMLTPSWWFKKMRLADFTLIALLRYIKQEWSSNITSSITSRPQNPLLTSWSLRIY